MTSQTQNPQITGGVKASLKIKGGQTIMQTIDTSECFRDLGDTMFAHRYGREICIVYIYIWFYQAWLYVADI
jgi:hypothetical protein